MSPYLAGLRARIGHGLLLLPAVAVVVRDPVGRLLLVRDRDSGSWSLPAGAVEPSESPREAARRELLEETGIECDFLEFVTGVGGHEFRHTYPNGDVVEYSIFVFRAFASADSIPDPKDGEEVAEARFFVRHAAPPMAWPYPESVLWPEDFSLRQR
jgi:8-oxo-dGTP pyrophosphatase MutT (NUDIX family)